MRDWPTTAAELIRLQEALGRAQAEAWTPSTSTPVVAGCFVCFPRGLRGTGARGDEAWAAAITLGAGREATIVVEGRAGAAYQAGLLALREGDLLERAVRALPVAPDVLLVNATGRDHPRGAGMALHLGARLDCATVGVTQRTLLARGGPPADDRGALAALRLEDDVVGYWLRARRGQRALAVHAAWRTSAEVAAALVMRVIKGSRTPEPLRRAREAARIARAEAGGTTAVRPWQAP